jgi:hypothetical protein
MSVQDIISGHSHSFDTGIAEELGLNSAIVFNHIVYWLRVNASKNSNQIDGKTWMYETQEDIAKCLTYLTIDEIKKTMVKLLKSGLLIKGNFNKNPFDRTNWYTVSDQSIIKKTLTKVPNGTIASAKSHDPTCDTAPCIHTEDKQEDKHNKQLHAQTATRLRTKDALSFNLHVSQFEGITHEDHESWQKIYPHVNLDIEISKAAEWLKSNPSKAGKKLWRKYLTGWFQRANDSIENKKAFKVAAKTTPAQTENLLSHLKHGEFYNSAECNISGDSISFTRGMNHGEVKFNAFGFEDRLKELLDRFQIKVS